MLAPHFCSIIRHSAWNIAPRLLHLGEEALGELGVRNVVYLARSRIENAQLIARQVKAANQCVPAAALVEQATDSQPSQYNVAEKCIIIVSMLAKAL